MESKEIVALYGMSGLFQLLSQKSGGAIVRSLETKETRFVSTRLHALNPIKGISIYLDNNDSVELMKVFREMLKQETGNPPVDIKIAKEEDVRNYFKTIVPEYDREKVHFSDIKKAIRWFQILKTENLISMEEEPAKVEENKDSDTVPKTTIKTFPKQIDRKLQTTAPKVIPPKQNIMSPKRGG